MLEKRPGGFRSLPSAGSSSWLELELEFKVPQSGSNFKRLERLSTICLVLSFNFFARISTIAPHPQFARSLLEN